MSHRQIPEGNLRVVFLVLVVGLAQVKTAVDETCSMLVQPQIIGHWDRAISTYDPIGRLLYLEFDVIYPAGESCTGEHE
eukprot:1654965-Rhodomonas_salina.2